MDRSTFIKISAAIFILLAVIISLFPPFEFNKSVKALVDEANQSILYPHGYYSFNFYDGNFIIRLKPLMKTKISINIAKKLPIKKYDFLFSSNKRYFALDSYSYINYFTENSLKAFKEKWNDKKYKFIATVDSFFTAKRFLFIPAFDYGNITAKDTIRLWQGLYNETLTWKEIDDKIDYKKYGLVDIDKSKFNYVINYPDYFWDTTKFITSCVNYWNVKKEYDKVNYYWLDETLFQFDSTGNYDKYLVTQPVYYLLDGKILFGELIVEYILAFFVSIIAGYLTSNLVSKMRAHALSS